MKWRISLSLGVTAALAAAGIASAATTGTAAQPEPSAAPAVKASAPAEFSNRLIVTYATATTDVQARQAPATEDVLTDAVGADVAVERKMSGNADVVTVPSAETPEDLKAAIDAIAAVPGVAAVEPDMRAYALSIPNDTRFSDQWDFLPNTSSNAGANITTAWSLMESSAPAAATTIVSVIDTGYRNHTDLSGQFVGGYDFISDAFAGNDGDGRDADALDPGDWNTAGQCGTGSAASSSSWHGLHVAGTIAAGRNNAKGIAGINNKAKILPVRVLGRCGGSFADIVDGMRWSAGLSVPGVPANPNKAKVLNLSLGGSGACPTYVQTAINEIVAAGTLIVVAAGNETRDASLSSPANCSNVITVASTGKDGNRASYSNFGASVEIAAPGGGSNDVGILSTLNAGTQGPGADSYAFYRGTSMAAPHVAGIASLLYSVDPQMTPAKATSILRTTAKPFKAGSTCSTSTCGAGLIDAAAAVTKAIGTPVVNPPTSDKPGSFAISSPTQNQKIARRPTITWSASAKATSYEYCYDTTVNGKCDGTWTSAAAATSVTLPKLTGWTTYEIQVRAKNTAGTTDAGNGTWRTFRTNLF